MCRLRLCTTLPAPGTRWLRPPFDIGCTTHQSTFSEFALAVGAATRAMASIQTGGPDGVTLHGIELRRRYAGDVNPRACATAWADTSSQIRRTRTRGTFASVASTASGRSPPPTEVATSASSSTTRSPAGASACGATAERVGTFTLGEMNGEGRLTRPDGGSYRGGWRANRRHGRGVDTHGPSGDTYDGEWVDGKRHGVGVAVLRSAGTRRTMARGNATRGTASRMEETDRGEMHEAGGATEETRRRRRPPRPIRRRCGASSTAVRRLRGRVRRRCSDRDPHGVPTRGF